MAQTKVQEQIQAQSPAPAPEVQAQRPEPEPKQAEQSANPTPADPGQETPKSDTSKEASTGNEGPGQDGGQSGPVAQDNSQEPGAQPDADLNASRQDSKAGFIESEGESDGAGGDGQDQDAGSQIQQESPKAASKKPVQTKAKQEWNSGDTKGSEDSDQGDQDDEDDEDDAYSEIRGGMSGQGRGEAGPGDEDADYSSDHPHNLESDQDDGPSFAELSGGLGAGLLGLSVPRADADADYQDEGNDGVDNRPPAISRKGKRANPTTEDEEVTAAARKLGHRGGVKSGQARRVRGIRLKRPEMQQVSQGQERQPRRKRPQWFKPPRLPGMKG